jgi:sugar phosphate permease
MYEIIAGGRSMAKLIAPPSIRRRQRSAVIMLVIAGTLNYLDRSTLSIANPLIRQELGLSIADMGLLLSAFLWAYAFAQLPGGALVDRVGPHRLLAAGLGLWSIAQAVAGFVTSFWQFSIARVFLGLGEAPMFSSAVRVVRDWYNVRDRGLPTGIWNCTSSLGMVVFTVVAAETASDFLAVAAISAALMFGASASGMSWALSSVAAPANCTASLGAIQNFGGYLGGAQAPTVTGFIVQATGSFVPALLVSAGIGLVSALMYLVVIRGEPITTAELDVVAGLNTISPTL